MRGHDPLRTLQLEADLGMRAPVEVRGLYCAACDRIRCYALGIDVLVFEGRDRRPWWRRRRGPCRCEVETRENMAEWEAP